MDWIWQVANLRKQSLLLGEYLRARCQGHMNTNQDLWEVNSLILKVFPCGWWEQELSLALCEPWKSFPLLLQGGSFPDLCSFLPHMHSSVLSEYWGETLLYGNSQKKYGYVSCLNIYLLLPGNIVLREITFSTTNTTMLKTAGVIHQLTDLFLCVEIIRWDPRKNFLLSTWRAFESGGCLKCFPCTNAWNKPKTEWPSWRLCLVEERKILQVISIRADESKLGNTCAIRSRVVGDQGQLFWESDF